jgi:cardiolipin synthase
MTHAVPPLRAGHHLLLLEGSRAFFPALIAAIDGARREVLLETYIFDFTGSGADVAYALGTGGPARVTVRLVIDGFGTPELPPFWEMRFDAARVQWALYSRTGAFGLLWPGQWRGLHRKLCVVDETMGFCGGINILDDYHDPNHGPLLSPRLDFSLRVEGPLVQQMHQTMQRQWSRIEAVGQLKRAQLERRVRAVARGAPAARRAAALPPRGTATCAPRCCCATTCATGSVIERAYLRAIGRARDEIIIANAYFVPGGRMRRALINAARRGVHVNLLVQGRYEYFMQYYASRPVFGALLRAGAHIHEYAPSFLHAKVAVIDGHWATIGSSNLDPLSLLLAREANVVVDDPALRAPLRERLLHAMVQEGKRMDPAAYEKRPPWQRVKERLALVVMRICSSSRGRSTCERRPAARRRSPPRLRRGEELAGGTAQRAIRGRSLSERPGGAAARGPVLSSRGLLHRSWRPVARAVVTHAHSDHARPATATTSRRAGRGRAAFAAGGHPAADAALRRAAAAPRRDGVPAPGGPRAGIAQVGWSTAARCGWPAATTRWRPIPPARRSSRCAATCSSPSPPSGCRSTAGARTRGLRRHRCLVGAQCLARARQRGRLLQLRQGAAPAERRRSFDRPDHRARRGAAIERGLTAPPASSLPETLMVTDVKDKADLRRCLVVCPPSAVGSPWLRRFGDAQTAFASGWMQVRGNRRRGGYDRGFVLSDHADWPGLLEAIAATGAGRVIVTHGSANVMVRTSANAGCRPRPSRPSTATTWWKPTCSRRRRAHESRGAGRHGQLRRAHLPGAGRQRRHRAGRGRARDGARQAFAREQRGRAAALDIGASDSRTAWRSCGPTS